ncbi:MAG: CCA tRNA nucleotidyltransferase [Phycisphaerales bacterium]
MTNQRSHLDERNAAIRIIDRLRDADHIAYLAGGCVRDQLLGVIPKDYDVATDARPEQISNLFERTAAVGAAFGVMLVRDFGPSIEVATFRSDGPYSDSRRPDHVHFSTPEMDAQRRDFTINALFLDPRDDGDQIIDFVGGKSDIDSKILRAVGNPEARLQEDHLRALRAVRFSARYGLSIDAMTSNAILAHASDLVGVSIERIGDEVHKMMNHRTRLRAAELMEILTLDRAIFSDHSMSNTHDALCDIDDSAHATTALAAWAFDRYGSRVLSRQGASQTSWATKLDMSNSQSEHFINVLEITGILIADWDSMNIAQRKRLASRTHAQEALKLLAALDSNLTSHILNNIGSMSSDGIGLEPEPMINGQTLIEMGHAPSRTFKDVLDRVYNAQLEGRIVNPESARKLAQELFIMPDKSDQ